MNRGHLYYENPLISSAPRIISRYFYILHHIDLHIQHRRHTTDETCPSSRPQLQIKIMIPIHHYHHHHILSRKKITPSPTTPRQSIIKWSPEYPQWQWDSALAVSSCVNHLDVRNSRQKEIDYWIGMNGILLEPNQKSQITW